MAWSVDGERRVDGAFQTPGAQTPSGKRQFDGDRSQDPNHQMTQEAIRMRGIHMCTTDGVEQRNSGNDCYSAMVSFI